MKTLMKSIRGMSILPLLALGGFAAYGQVHPSTASDESTTTRALLLTQEMHNTIDSSGVIHFKSPNSITNRGSKPITTTEFVNSDFVFLTRIYEEDGTAVPFVTTHEGRVYRYRITFNRPIMAGASMVYCTEGTIKGLIKPVPDSNGLFKYHMIHKPGGKEPVLRIETYLLPKGAVLVSTNPSSIEVGLDDGRIRLRHEEVVPAGGRILTEFSYRLSADTPGG